MLYYIQGENLEGMLVGRKLAKDYIKLAIEAYMQEADSLVPSFSMLHTEKREARKQMVQ